MPQPPLGYDLRIWGRLANQRRALGLPLLFECLRRHGLRATFFLEPFGSSFFGGRPFRLLLPADSVWAILLWYQFEQETRAHGRVPDAEKKFIVLSHTTSEALIRLATKFGLGQVIGPSFAGFAYEASGSFTLPTLVVAATLVVAFALTMEWRRG